MRKSFSILNSFFAVLLRTFSEISCVLAMIIEIARIFSSDWTENTKFYYYYSHKIHLLFKINR